MATLALVHGSFHGGWCWQRVVRLLEEDGHDVWTPTLAGLAERAHLLAPDVDLGTHTRDVTELLRFEDLQDVVGHSYERGKRLPVRQPPTAHVLGVDDPADAAWIESRMTPHPLNTYTQPVPDGGEAVPGAFVHCTEGALSELFGSFARRARDRGWPVHEIATGHEATVTEPAAVARLLDRRARVRSPGTFTPSTRRPC